VRILPDEEVDEVIRRLREVLLVTPSR